MNSGGGQARSGAREPKIALVAAVALNGVIGRNGRLPWRIRSELRHFRQVTMGKPVIMGRKTYGSIAKPLAGRTNIVVSRNFAAAGVVAAPSVEAALVVARGDALRRGVDEIVVIGGAEIYQQTMDKADRLIITRVQLEPEGDTRLGAVDDALWTEVSRTEHPAGPQDEASFTLHVYERRSPHSGKMP